MENGFMRGMKKGVYMRGGSCGKVTGERMMGRLFIIISKKLTRF